MRRISYLIIWLVLWTEPLWAQVHWIAGGALGSSARIRKESGSVSLLSVPDREWSIGLTKPMRTRSKWELGFLATAQFHSPFYELSTALPYYPLKKHLPTFQLEAIQVYPFFSYSDQLAGLPRWKGWLRAGPVFGFHSGNFISTTMGRTQPGGTTFVMYQTSVHRQPIGIPFLRLQAGFSYAVLTRSRTTWMLHPYVQAELLDRSRTDYQILPNDPVYVSAGQMRSGNWSFGVLCSIGKKR